MEHAPTPHKPIILIIDDNAAIADIIQRIIKIDGKYEPVVAYDGVAGLEAFEEVHPVCVIVDAKMPNMNGYEFLRCIRGDLSTASAALIMLTALVQPADRETGLLSGADEYLTKPFRATELLAAIERAQRVTPEERLAKLQAMLADVAGDSC